WTAFQARVPTLPSNPEVENGPTSQEVEYGRQMIANAVLSTVKLLLGAPPGIQPDATTVCGTANEYQSLTLSCPAGQRIVDLPFASYGMPGGQCGGFSH